MSTTEGDSSANPELDEALARLAMARYEDYKAGRTKGLTIEEFMDFARNGIQQYARERKDRLSQKQAQEKLEDREDDTHKN